MISYEDYIDYKVHNEVEYIKDLIAEGYFEDSEVENATDEQIEEIARRVIHELKDNDYLNEVLCQCENDEIEYQIKEMFGKKNPNIEKWVDDIFQLCCNDDNWHTENNGKTTIVYDLNNGKVSFARCHSCDNFDRIKGIIIAYCRLRNLPIPKEIFE